MKRPESSGSDKPRGGGCPDPRLKKTCPNVVEYMTDSAWEDGKPRDTSTLTVFLEDGMVKVALNDRACSRSLYASSDTLEGAIGALEQRLREQSPEWRSWKGRKK